MGKLDRLGSQAIDVLLILAIMLLKINPFFKGTVIVILVDSSFKIGASPIHNHSAQYSSSRSKYLHLLIEGFILVVLMMRL